MQSHYNYVFDNITNTYNFTTKNSILYRVAFVVDETFSSISGEDIPNVFQIVIEKANDEPEPLDIKVSKTIENIIDRFFKKIENALIYICDDLDSKAKVRYLVFERWYKKSDLRADIIKMDKVIEVVISGSKVHKLYTSFIFHKRNSNFEKLLEIYSKIEEVLNEEKN